MEGLASLDGLQTLRSAGGLYLFHDVQLRSLEGLEGLDEVRGPVQLWELYALETAVFPALTALQGKLDLFESDALHTIEAPQLTSLGAYELHHCDAMQDLGWFPEVRSMQGELRVQYNAGLTSLGGFPALRQGG